MFLFCTVEAVSTTHQEPVPLRSYSSPQVRQFDLNGH